MDFKQKKQILVAVYRAIIFLSALSIGWILYLTIDKIANNTSSILWMDITLPVISSLLLLFMLLDIDKTRHIKNKFGIAQYLFFIIFNSIIALIVGAFVFYYKNIDISAGYLFAICLIFAIEMMCVMILFIGLKLSKLYKNLTVTIDSESETPNFDDELALKKKLNDINRKLEMKKVQEEIANKQRELDEN